MKKYSARDPHAHGEDLITKTLRMVVDWMGVLKMLLLLLHRRDTLYTFVNYAYTSQLKVTRNGSERLGLV